MRAVLPSGNPLVQRLERASLDAAPASWPSFPASTRPHRRRPFSHTSRAAQCPHLELTPPLSQPRYLAPGALFPLTTATLAPASDQSSAEHVATRPMNSWVFSLHPRTHSLSRTHTHTHTDEAHWHTNPPPMVHARTATATRQAEVEARACTIRACLSLLGGVLVEVRRRSVPSVPTVAITAEATV